MSTIQRYKNSVGWEYVLGEDGQYHATNGPTVFHHKDGTITTTHWWSLVYTKEMAEKCLTPVNIEELEQKIKNK